MQPSSCDLSVRNARRRQDQSRRKNTLGSEQRASLLGQLGRTLQIGDEDGVATADDGVKRWYDLHADEIATASNCRRPPL